MWSSEGSAAREHFPIVDPEVRQDANQDTNGGAPGGTSADSAGRERARSSWVLVGSLRESAQELALAPLPDDVDICLAEAEELMVARDRITCALADRVGRVHRAGQAKRHGHASTRSWLRTAGGMGVAGAGRLLTVAVELARLPRVRAAFVAGELAAGVVEAICTATARLSDEQAGLAEPILLELAGKAGPGEVAKAGRYLRAVLDPDGEERDEQADYGRRFLRVRSARGGGLEGEFYLPREAAARLRALLDAYAKPRAEGDDRPPSVRNADAFIALLEQEIATELLVLVNAESLPTDPEPEHPGHAEAAGPSEADNTSGCTPSDTGSAADSSEADNTGGHGDLGTAADPGTAEAEAGAEVGVAAGAGAESADRATTAARDAESVGPGAGERGSGEERARERQASECGPRDAASTAAAGGDGAAARTGATHARRTPARPTRGGSGHPTTAPPNTAQPDPPPEDAPGHHTHAGHRPAGDCRHGQATPGGHGHEQRGYGEGGYECGGGARCSSAAPGTPRPEPETPPGTAPGTPPGASPGVLQGALLGTAPGLLLATGQMLPVSSVHRLARTSTLVRLVMNAEGQVLDMGRKVRLATPAQRRAVFARYATCWIDGCPLPATMCQIDHADNWSTGGLTDLKLLGPACQFHNRDRYRHPDRYTRHKAGADRWAFTYHNPNRARRLQI
ncbi:DUF222 domain-containing protein [Microbispora sp. NEAU-D428]|uniref:HNH endonuclease signature motif containing protein n=1 Tax=Microbispora sitophila TaxID=2771537 RepID=UPI0018682F4D|nr:HNH endonuclease signature motif containing protein [Microbispora sitophila]MBE3010529.1 DUF222 domain-containing protein [Microbispora sitophila]